MGPNYWGLIWLSYLDAIPGTVPSNASEHMVYSKSQRGTSWSHEVQMAVHSAQSKQYFFQLCRQLVERLLENQLTSISSCASVQTQGTWYKFYHLSPGLCTSG